MRKVRCCHISLLIKGSFALFGTFGSGLGSFALRKSTSGYTLGLGAEIVVLQDLGRCRGDFLARGLSCHISILLSPWIDIL